MDKQESRLIVGLRRLRLFAMAVPVIFIVLVSIMWPEDGLARMVRLERTMLFVSCVIAAIVGLTIFVIRREERKPKPQACQKKHCGNAVLREALDSLVGCPAALVFTQSACSYNGLHGNSVRLFGTLSKHGAQYRFGTANMGYFLQFSLLDVDYVRDKSNLIKLK